MMAEVKDSGEFMCRRRGAPYENVAVVGGGC